MWAPLLAWQMLPHKKKKLIHIAIPSANRINLNGLITYFAANSESVMCACQFDAMLSSVANVIRLFALEFSSQLYQ